MGITSSGVWCDVCGTLILDSFERFDIKGLSIEAAVVGTNCCKQALQEMGETNDYTVLPDGPLRRAIHRALEERNVTEG